jgi:hypothetical protein
MPFLAWDPRLPSCLRLTFNGGPDTMGSHQDEPTHDLTKL